MEEGRGGGCGPLIPLFGFGLKLIKFETRSSVNDGVGYYYTKLPNKMSFEEKINPINTDYNQLAKFIYGDLSHIIKQIKNQDNQTWRRLYIRTMATALEAQISYIQRHIKVVREFDYLPLEENEEIQLNGKKRLSFEQKTIFMLNLFSEANYTTLKVNAKSSDWKQFKTLIKVRNRLTHPKTSKDFEVTVDEVKICEHAFNKFQDSLLILKQKSGESLEVEASRLREILSTMSK